MARRIRRRRAKRILVVWNRGLGDIALGMCRVVDELRSCAPGAVVTVLTRTDLAEAFALLPVERVLSDPGVVRSQPVHLSRTLARLGESEKSYDVIVARPDPTHWFRGRPGGPPRLVWNARLNALSRRFDAFFDDADGPRIDVAVHVQSETSGFYKYRKDWPIDAWRALFAEVQARHAVRFVLFGHHAEQTFDAAEVVDLRGRTSVLEMMSLIKDRCRMLIAPDSGVLTTIYYLDIKTPIDVISLWADPRQGILKQGVPSPNPLLRHRALLSPDERVEHIDVATVSEAVETMLSDWIERTPTNREPALGMIPE